MDITSVTSVNRQTSSASSGDELALKSNAKADPLASPEKAAEAAQQFEAVLMRQFLTESMKGLLNGGAAGNVYGYLLTDSLADSITKAGGVGLSNVLQAQLKQ